MVTLYRRAADAGDAGGHFGLGLCYENGTGVERDLYQAAELCRRAAITGYTGRQVCIAACYENGEGVEKNLALPSTCTVAQSVPGTREDWLVFVFAIRTGLELKGR